MVGRQTLDLLIEVRILAPQPLILAGYRPAVHLTERAFCVVKGRGGTDVAGGCTFSAQIAVGTDRWSKITLTSYGGRATKVDPTRMLRRTDAERSLAS